MTLRPAAPETGAEAGGSRIEGKAGGIEARTPPPLPKQSRRGNGSANPLPRVLYPMRWRRGTVRCLKRRNALGFGGPRALGWEYRHRTCPRDLLEAERGLEGGSRAATQRLQGPVEAVGGRLLAVGNAVGGRDGVSGPAPWGGGGCPPPPLPLQAIP